MKVIRKIAHKNRKKQIAHKSLRETRNAATYAIGKAKSFVKRAKAMI